MPEESCSVEHAIWHASWFLRYGLDRAPGTPGMHPGVIAHLKAASVQLTAAERIDRESRLSRPSPEEAKA